ncbi:TIGR04283 family arsenosugar biosynthesis glycosyltransferase [uncultured Tateyamaria sp.]|uniref:TIGR04283 family arsenosugar biosynthesis glycosyltransferase n=1 Tax=uncultured Tateyamaria sp. TaxID=455651 RepID=UPI0026330FD2|nr:TIGR04283 family arsenosugar biosynthesis glycosyltransferase [uncultured Tateyamaria sp.]
MAAPISVIIPTLNAQADLSACLAALVEGLDTGLITELVISDGGSTDETLKLADAWGANIVTGAPSRGGQLRRGCEGARGEWLLVIHADTVLDPGWSAVAAAHLTQRKAAYFKLRFDRGGRFVAAWANLRARVFGLPYGDQGLLISRRLYDAVGGFPNQPLMEDVALARALKGQLVALDAIAVTSSAKYRAQGWARRGARNLWTLLRYFIGTDPATLARAYRR